MGNVLICIFTYIVYNVFKNKDKLEGNHDKLVNYNVCDNEESSLYYMMSNVVRK